MARAGLTTESVVAAAAALADGEGLQALTLARLASTLGVKTPSLYAHVGGLDDLHARLARRGALALADALAAATAGRSGHDALTALADAYRRYARAHPGSYAALQRAPGPRAPDPRTPDPDATAPDPADAAARVVGVVLAVLRGYGLDGDDAIHAVRVIRAALHGFVLLEAEGGFGIPLDLDESFARLVATLDGGLAARRSGTPV